MRAALLGYGWALLLSGFGLALQWRMWSLLEPAPFLLFYAVVFFSAWYGGLGPGILATLLSGLAIDYVFLQNRPGAVHLTRPHHPLPLVVSIVLGLLITRLCASLRLAYRRSERALQAAEAAEHRSAFLAQASETLASSLDYLVTLDKLAQLAVSRMADWCVVDMVQGDGSLERLAVAHVDPTKVEMAREIGRRIPLDPGAPRGPALVLRTGEPELVPEIPDEAFTAFTQDPEQLKLIRSLGLCSCICVPLAARGQVRGVITLVYAESGRRYTPADLAFAEELARHASLAVDNAQLYRELQEAVRVRDEFLSVASHELKTPLSTLQLSVQSLLRNLRRSSADSFSFERARVRMEGAERQVKRLTMLINRLLDISRITAGRLHLELEDVDLSVMVRDVVARFQEELTRAGCLISVQAGEPVIGRWDRMRADQIVTNLLSNAIKYGQGKPIEITVDATQDLAWITVRDHGIGIAAEHQKRIFERFERAVSERHYGGFGLGLWIVRRIVEAMGGTIRVVSQPGAGSTFTVELPRAHAEDARAAG